MNKTAKIMVMAALAVTVLGAIVLKTNKPRPGSEATATSAAVVSAQPAEASPVSGKPRPKLLDLGAGKCIPCKMMAPILEELQKEYAGRMNVEFIDVGVNPDAGKPYGIEVIPTQIFFDAEGKELFRHIGFFGKEDILGKWKELDVDLSASPAAAGKTTNQVVAYYFHGKVRCETCLKIERLAFETIQRRFASELAASRLVFISVNYDQPENRTCQEKYKLPCPSLVVARRETGKEEKWKLLGETWQLIEDTNKFNQYVGNEVESFLKNAE
jgi:thioredoxin 1